MEIRHWHQIQLFRLLCLEEVPEFSVITEWDLCNQRVIHIDVERTRSEDISAEERVVLENMLTFYCKQTGTSYKQGMNEVLVPFVLTCRQGVPPHIAYTCYKSFIEKSLKTMFSDDTFRPLQMMFILISLLLKYHSPKLSNLFIRHQISPEIYSTSWLLTMYSSKIPDIFLLFELWEEIIKQNDVLFPCYIAIAILDIVGLDLARDDPYLIPVSLNRLKLKDKQTLDLIINKSKVFKKIAPVSISNKLKQYDVYNLQRIEAYIEGLKESTCLGIMPREIMLLVYPESKICNCEGKCNMCDISYPVIIIDCRALSEQKQGHFPNTTFLTDKDLADLPIVPEQFLGIRGIYHFALMGSDKNDSELVTRLAQCFIEYEFPYISIIEGGFSSCHQFAVLFQLEIKNHNKKFCGLCVEQDRIKLSQKNCEPGTAKNEVSFVEKRFECKVQGTKQERKKDKDFLVLAEKQIFLVNGNRITEKLDIADLVKISTIKESKKILVFQFNKIIEKKKIVFVNSSQAKECLQEVTNLYRSLQSDLIITNVK